MKTRHTVTRRATTAFLHSSGIAKPNKAKRDTAWHICLQHLPDFVLWSLVRHMRIAPSKFFDFSQEAEAFLQEVKGALKALLATGKLNYLLPDKCVNIRVDATNNDCEVHTHKEHGLMDAIYRKHFAPVTLSVLTGQYVLSSEGMPVFRRDGHVDITVYPAKKQAFVHKWILERPTISTNVKVVREDAGKALLALACA